MSYDETNAFERPTTSSQPMFKSFGNEKKELIKMCEDVMNIDRDLMSKFKELKEGKAQLQGKCPPPWIKATNGYSKRNPGDGACLGVSGNGNSSFIGGVSYNLGVCTSLVAEMQAALHVIYIAFDRDWRWLWLETDSMAIISWFSNM
ncbi:hypothetical protein LWI28_000112 [Acer negundo]|uniref:RNase H type-1 domain-containing protein n=1 Tax=Acer negundo TaxID=4023 RepID=A0AAD5INM7_ACENE|nr:hypothetical protein LWI28_000112 [Acer negundo]